MMFKQEKGNLKKNLEDQKVWKMVNTWTSKHVQIVMYAGSDFNFNRTVFEYVAVGRYTEVNQL